jgi:uncharacterized damage-inducible protein DinB
MKLTELFLAELEREAICTRAALRRVPEGHNDWKPHPRSMALGHLAGLVAKIPSWVAMMVKQDEIDLKAPESERFKPVEWRTRNELISALDAGLDEARQALSETTDQHLMRPWKFVADGQLVNEDPRHIMIRDAVFSDLAQHRGQLTVYLRLNDASVSGICGPSADAGLFDAHAV